MLNAAVIASILLSLAALWLALTRARTPRSAAREVAELRDWLGRELATLRTRLDAQRDRAAQQAARLHEQQSRLSELAEAQAESRRELEGVRALGLGREEESGAGGGSGTDEVSAPGSDETVEEEEDVFAVARRLESFFSGTTHPRELLGNETFLRGAQLSRADENTAWVLLARATDYDAILACMSLEALSQRVGDDPVVVESVLRDINAYYYWPRFFALRALDAHNAGRPVLARLLVRLNSTWRDPIPGELLREFVAGRVRAGEELTAAALIAEAKSLGLGDEQTADIAQTLETLGDALPAHVREGFARWQGRRATAVFLKTVGRVWESDEEAGGEVFMLDAVSARVAELEAALTREPARSVLLVGDSGTGKTALVRALARSLREDGWIVFEASAADVLA
ncbi:MAG TPA: AAA family ATPase, partial [Pyrinomonadaceae bacterium]|nr:AAA family ATPase [Pyrinomonadaceae bacterium]